MRLPEVVLDTNLLVAGLRSRRGASARVLALVGTGKFNINLSVPLVLEYEDVLLRPEAGIPLTKEAVDDILNYHCAVARQHPIFFLWRPFLRDPKDDMVLELAVKAECDFIVTFNEKDFTGIEQFGLEALTPADFLKRIGAS
ncbi:MAG TPA: putative toxin-antitoxin system toxin component, PIN family [Longimicrobium sp.]|nr:putative toxin-antitoxin system toxin component, PIN family [Longimicrobium sp.]